VLLFKKDLADVLFRRLMQRSQQSSISYHLTGDACVSKCLNKNKLDEKNEMLKNKTLMFDI